MITKWLNCHVFDCFLVDWTWHRSHGLRKSAVRSRNVPSDADSCRAAHSANGPPSLLASLATDSDRQVLPLLRGAHGQCLLLMFSLSSMLSSAVNSTHVSVLVFFIIITNTFTIITQLSTRGMSVCK